MTKYLELPIIEINKLLKNKTIKPIDLINEAFINIEANVDLNAFITLDKEGAIKKAIELENVEIDNVMFGIPIVLKDNMCTKNMRTTCASHILENFTPIYDAAVVEKINSVNMIIIGKTNMDEFAMGSTGETSYFGPALNPWNKEMVPGGSSSGSAVAVAANLACVALGSDTGGSIRQPASFTGIVGLKPSYGRVSRYGLIAFGSSLDQIGPFSKTVYDNALLLNLISGFDKRDLTSNNVEEDFTSLIGKDISGMKIAIPNFYMSDMVDVEVKDNVLKVVDILKNNNVSIDYIDIDYIEYAIPLYQVIALGEASSNLARFDGIKYGYHPTDYSNIEEMYAKTRSEGFGKEVKRRIMVGSYVLSGENAHIYYEKALKIRNKMKLSFDKVFEKYDLIIGPVATSPAFKIGMQKDDAVSSFLNDLFTIPANMAGLPGMSLPIGFSNNKLPIGLQIIGGYMNEVKIYQLASFIEKELKSDMEVK